MALPFDPVAPKHTSVDEYIASFADDVRPVLEDVRRAVVRAIPGVEESISYDMATFSRSGRYVLYVAGWKRHVSLHAVGVLPDALEADVAAFRSGNGTVKFPLHSPMPLALIGRIAAEMALQRAHG
jgi:uncharacterized protein YdhG (YjbR/CyaY superfamily)